MDQRPMRAKAEWPSDATQPRGSHSYCRTTNLTGIYAIQHSSIIPSSDCVSATRGIGLSATRFPREEAKARCSCACRAVVLTGFRQVPKVRKTTALALVGGLHSTNYFLNPPLYATMYNPFASSSPESPGRRPWLLEIRSSKAFIVSAVCMAVFTVRYRSVCSITELGTNMAFAKDLFLYGVIVPVVPFALQSRAGVKPEDTQYWVSVLVAIYGAFLLAASPVWGYISDKTTTRRAPLLVGLLMLAGSTGILCAGTSIALWIVGRALQGISAAVVWTTGLALLVDTVGKNDVAQYLGYVGMCLSMAILIAPLLGGVVFDQGGYYSVFGMCFALIGVDILLRLVMIERRVAKRWLEPESKPPGSSSSAKSHDDPAVASNILEPGSGKSTTPAPAQLPPPRVTIMPGTRTTKLPPIITLLSSRRLLAALWAALVQASLLTAFDSTLPIYVRSIFSWTSLGAGLIFLPVALPSLLAPVVGYFSDRYGPRWFAAVGFLLAVPPLVLLRYVDHNSLKQKVLLCALLALIGIALDLTFPPVMAEITYVVNAKERARPGLFGDRGAYAQAYALFNMAFAGGCLIGPLWGGLIQESAGWGTMAWTLGLLSGVTAIPTALMMGGWITGGKEAERRVHREEDIADEKAAKCARKQLEDDVERAQDVVSAVREAKCASLAPELVPRPVVLHQVPEGSVTPLKDTERANVAASLHRETSLSQPTGASQDTPQSATPTAAATPNTAQFLPRQPLFDFATVSDFIIPRQEFCNQLLTVCTNHYRIIGFPVCIADDTRYSWNRNEYIFNFCVVLDEYAEPSAHIKVVKRVARMLRVLEEESGFLSGDEEDGYCDQARGHGATKGTGRMIGEDGLGMRVLDDEQHRGGGEYPQDQDADDSQLVEDVDAVGETEGPAGQGKVYALCEMLLEDLNNYCECMIPVDGTTNLSIRLAPTLPPPPAVRAWHVPVPTVRLAYLTDSNWDLTMLALLPYLDGTHTVAAAARRANTRLDLARAAIQDLLYYGCVLLLDAFTFGAVYAPTPSISSFVADDTSLSSTADLVLPGDDAQGKLLAEVDGAQPTHSNVDEDGDGAHISSSSQQAECAAFVARPGCSVTRDELIHLYCSLRPGLALRHWCADPARAEILSRVDVRRLITFGVIGGFLYRVHRYALTPLRLGAVGPSNPNGRDNDSATVTGSAPAGGSKKGDTLPLARYLDGLHCIDEMCTELEMGERAVLALTALAAVSSAAPTKRQTTGEVVGYWGSGGGSRALADYCSDDAGYDIIVMSFISQYGNGNAPSGGFTAGDGYCSINADGSGDGCDQVAADIKTCQAAGKKLVLALGGGGAPGTLTSQGDAEGVAYSLWNSFGPASLSDGQAPRPLGDANVNGFDLDIETADGEQYYPALVSKLREYFATDSANKYLITGAPQCVLPEANMGTVLDQSKFDYLWVQFYNNEEACDASNFVYGSFSGGEFNYDAWTDYLSGGPSADAKLVVGIPASVNAARPNSFIQPQDLPKLVQEVQGKPQFSGIMFWEAAESDTINDNGCTFAQSVKRVLTTGSAC
ncbi:hypothetical protein FH972_025224 [Carpinus fangiana]|uniref:Uncharacterized protein n=1 Tax=Carpinus fangiana TaxID=176857 RepID=A0A5N6L1C8_9ROSI|nr:hypothetical protein FH972_025224 [Carpinus fangiana]